VTPEAEAKGERKQGDAGGRRKGTEGKMIEGKG
jgi:hypothetical protein